MCGCTMILSMTGKLSWPSLLKIEAVIEYLVLITTCRCELFIKAPMNQTNRFFKASEPAQEPVKTIHENAYMQFANTMR